MSSIDPAFVNLINQIVAFINSNYLYIRDTDPVLEAQLRVFTDHHLVRSTTETGQSSHQTSQTSSADPLQFSLSWAVDRSLYCTAFNAAQRALALTLSIATVPSRPEEASKPGSSNLGSQTSASAERPSMSVTRPSQGTSGTTKEIPRLSSP